MRVWYSSARPCGSIVCGSKPVAMRKGAACADITVEMKRAKSKRTKFITTSNDLEIALQFPVGHTVEPLPPLPLARRGEVVDEGVAEPIARDRRLPEVAGGLDQGARRTRHVLGPLVGAGDRRRAQLQSLLDTVQPGRDHRGHREVGVD